MTVSPEIILPLIIWWTRDLYPHLDDPATLRCPGNHSCTVSRTRTSPAGAADVTYLFYGTDFAVDDLPLPRRGERWGLLHEESPYNKFILSHGPAIRLFNFTSTFRRDSHFPITTLSLPGLGYLTARRPVPVGAKNKLRKTGGLAPVVYLQSNCETSSDRDRYVRKLMEYIDVDSYGRCLHNKDLPDRLVDTATMDDEQLLQILAQYKFQIAFENAVCDDYITEKLWRTFHIGVVPIYRGSPSVKDWIPTSDSIVSVSDFGSPRELATRLISLDRNDQLYNRYLTYKDSGIENQLLKTEMVVRNWEDDFVTAYECFVCTRVHLSRDSRQPASTSPDQNHLGCPRPFPSLGRLEDVPSSDHLWTAIGDWDFAKTQAEVLSEIVQSGSNGDEFWSVVEEREGRVEL